MHYNDHLGRQAISFLRKLMKRYGSDMHQMPEYFEDYFFTMLPEYNSLYSLLMCDYKEGSKKNENK